MKLGITGPIASGKSCVSKMLVPLCDIEVIDADAIGRQVVEQDPDLCRSIAAKLGTNKVLGPKGLDREATARIVFGDSAKLQVLNVLVRPLLLAKIRERLTQSGCTHVVVDAALLLDWGLEKELDGVLAVMAPKQIRLERLIQKGFSLEDARGRIMSQGNWDSRAHQCQWRIDNDSSLEVLQQKVLAWWQIVS